MSRNSLLSRPSRFLCEHCGLLILIAVHFAIHASGTLRLNEPKVWLFTNDSTLVYEFSDSPSINQVLLVRERDLLVAGTNFVYLFKEQIYRKEEESKNSEVSFGFLGKNRFPNGTASPVNEIKILTEIAEDRFLVCGTINYGKCYRLYANIGDPPKSVYELKLKDKLADNAKYNYLGYTDVRCEKQGFFQHPLNCSRFYSCFRRGLGLYRNDFDCPFVTVANGSTSLGG